MSVYPSAPSPHTSPRPVTPSICTVRSDQNIPYSNPGSRAVSPSFFDQQAYPNQASGLDDASYMEFFMSNLTPADRLMEAQILDAMSNDTSFSNSNVGLEGFDIASPSSPVIDPGFPSRQLASQMSSPFVGPLDTQQPFGYPADDVTNWMLGEQNQNPSPSAIARDFPLTPTLTVTDADGAQQSTISPFTSRSRNQSFSSVPELPLDLQYCTQQDPQIYQQLWQEITDRDTTIQELRSTNGAQQSRIQSLEKDSKAKTAQLATMQEVIADLWKKPFE